MMEEKIPFESKRCPFCRETQILQVYPSHLRAWRRGTLIQDALPELNEHERETLVTGICRTCWGIYICPTGEEPSEEFFNAAGECNALVEDFRQSLRMTHDFNVVDRVAADHVARAGELREDLERWAREKNKEIEENRRSLES